MKIFDRVDTPEGPGTITAIDSPDSRATRYGVKLDNNYLNFTENCYYFFPNELELIDK